MKDKKAMKTITFCSFKGGTSKTSTALNLGACLAKFHEKKILLLDFDPQANLSVGLGIGADRLETMVPVLQRQVDIQSVIVDTSVPNLALIPSNAYLDGIDRKHPLVNDQYAHERVRKELSKIEEEYDFCFIDTPPSLGWLTQSAFYASDYSIVCAIPEAYSIIALERLKEFFEAINENHRIDVLGVLLTFWNDKGAINDELLGSIEESFPQKILKSKVRRDIAVSRAVFEGVPVEDFDPTSRAANDYKVLAEEILDRLSKIDLKVEEKINV
ncbi:MAG: ParA family protein [Chlamydiia bacterium]|nr:ParA family protein [Simkania sp.]MCB1073351.1 ParA family protein [Chlamydiia bacterium]MCP5491399.1 ParA family protein [Chlamydiales bacterium]